MLFSKQTAKSDVILHPPAAPPAVATSSDSKGHKISFRSLTHEDCQLWFQQMEYVFTVQDITSQVNKLAALTTLKRPS